MIKAKHTPGPWKIDYGYNRSINFIGPCVPDQYAGSSWLQVTEANARLIAAAPELLEALQEVTMVLDSIFGVEGREPDAESISGRARAAISKATRSEQ